MARKRIVPKDGKRYSIILTSTSDKLFQRLRIEGMLANGEYSTRQLFEDALESLNKNPKYPRITITASEEKE